MADWYAALSPEQQAFVGYAGVVTVLFVIQVVVGLWSIWKSPT